MLISRISISSQERQHHFNGKVVINEALDSRFSMLYPLKAEHQTHPQTSRAGSKLCKRAMCELAQMRVSDVPRCAVSLST